MVDLGKIIKLDQKEFQQFAKLIYNESGIFLKDTKITLLSNRLRKRLKSLNLDTFSEYFNYIDKLSNKSKEIERLLDVVSTNETYFFRNERQFDALMKSCFLELSKTKKFEKRLRIWSAGCSSGEEPYTLGICILEHSNLFPDWDIEIIATDIAPSMLEFAKKGEYSGRKIGKVPENFLKKYFIQNKENPELFAINDNVKKLVKFRYLNLFKDPYPEKLDIIFCRNVMIYFDREHQSKLVAGFNRSIFKHGYLFIGHSETLHSISEDFIYKKILESPVYVVKERVED